MHKNTLIALFLAVLPAGCAQTPSDAAASADRSVPEDGWVDLFNGEDFTGWHTYGKESVGRAWKVVDGTMHLDAASKAGWQTNEGGDIVTDAAYANYELELDWKIGECGNSGIIYNVHEAPEFDYPWRTGPEMQVLDNTCHPDGKIPTHRAGDLYDMVSVAEENVNPAGEWNHVKLVVTDGWVEHWLNGKLQVAYPNEGPEWEAMIADSKFKNFPRWGTFTSGQISLQDHGDPVWYRNVRLRQR
ncbi:MAG: DUF1080 domain-containing protein [Planctomycetota bacterium]